MAKPFFVCKKISFLHFETVPDATEEVVVASLRNIPEFIKTAVIIGFYERGLYIKGALCHKSRKTELLRNDLFVAGNLLKKNLKCFHFGEPVMVLFYDNFDLKIDALFFTFPERGQHYLDWLEKYTSELITMGLCSPDLILNCPLLKKKMTIHRSSKRSPVFEDKLEKDSALTSITEVDSFIQSKNDDVTSPCYGVTESAEDKTELLSTDDGSNIEDCFLWPEFYHEDPHQTTSMVIEISFDVDLEVENWDLIETRRRKSSVTNRKESCDFEWNEVIHRIHDDCVNEEGSVVMYCCMQIPRDDRINVS